MIESILCINFIYICFIKIKNIYNIIIKKFICNFVGLEAVFFCCFNYNYLIIQDNERFHYNNIDFVSNIISTK